MSKTVLDHLRSMPVDRDGLIPYDAASIARQAAVTPQAVYSTVNNLIKRGKVEAVREGRNIKALRPIDLSPLSKGRPKRTASEQPRGRISTPHLDAYARAKARVQDTQRALADYATVQFHEDEMAEEGLRLKAALETLRVQHDLTDKRLVETERELRSMRRSQRDVPTTVDE